MPKPTRIDAQLIYSASETDANMLWATRFFAPDPFIFIKKGRKTYLVMNDLEIDRAKSQASVNNVLSYSEYARRWQQRGIQFPPAAEVLAEGYVPSHTIVSSGDQCVDPHNQGTGPIRANTSIIMDIFPRSQKTGYFGDITRTVVRGRASDRLRHAYHCVEKGQQIAFRRIRHGANAYDIHNEILNYFKTEGFETGAMKGRMQGFFHGTGHGLGLDIHEAPSFGLRSKNALRRGNVVTVEPGLYYEEMGGVRLEDVVIVTKAGCKNLVGIPKVLEV